jgi:hypothetical protein
MRNSCLVVGALLLTVVAGGCGSSREEAPSRAADRFETAVMDGDADAVCALLAAATVEELEQASGKPCPASVLEEVEPGGPRVGLARFGTQAQVRYRSDVLFLTDGPQGWRVLAATCTPVSHAAPYDCDISGG